MATHLLKTKEISYENARVSAVTDSIRQLVKAVTSKQVAHSDYTLEVTDENDSIRQLVKAVTSKQVAHSDYALEVTDENDQMKVRGVETNAGDIVADAYRHAMNADIGMENGGGIRNDIRAGDITYGDVIGMLPYDNTLRTLRRIAVSGQQIQAMLTRCTAMAPVLDGNFPQVSGLRFTLHTKRHCVTDVEVLQANGTYKPIDPHHTYSVAVTDYNHIGGGFFDCFKPCPVLYESTLRYYEALADYLGKVLGEGIY